MVEQFPFPIRSALVVLNIFSKTFHESPPLFLVETAEPTSHLWGRWISELSFRLYIGSKSSKNNRCLLMSQSTSPYQTIYFSVQNSRLIFQVHIISSDKIPLAGPSFRYRLYIKTCVLLLFQTFGPKLPQCGVHICKLGLT